MLPQLRSAVHDAVPDRGWSHVAVRKQLSDTAYGVLLTGDRRSVGRQRIVAGIPGVKFAGPVADRFRLAGEQHLGPRCADAIQAEFERGGSAIQRENVGLWLKRHHDISRGDMAVTRSSASHGSPACRRRAR
jgi:hypothetical protein